MSIDIRYQYPNNPEFIYETRLERINLDEERIDCLRKGKGFIISEPQSHIKKDLKSPNSIYSSRFGMTLDDVNPFADRYKCLCGNLRSRINSGEICPMCGKEVKYVDDDFNYFGWIVLKDPYYIIHPNIFKSLDRLFGQNKLKQRIIDNILIPSIDKDSDGYTIESKRPKDEPYFGIGMLMFKTKFEEIMEYYINLKPTKKDYYDDIMKDKDKIFIQSIPVYTTHLRPYKADRVSFSFEGTNSIYNMMAKLGVKINQDELRLFRKKKNKIQLLYDLNKKYQELYKEIEKIISDKKGTIRSLFGGRLELGCLGRDVQVYLG